jgi:ribose 5-phosphate isomerase B
LGTDHAGFPLTDELRIWLNETNCQVNDLGAYEFDASDDYPDFAKLVGEHVASGASDKGLIICGSGVGACIAANKVVGARAGICHDVYSAHQGVEHDDMNVLCLGARIIGIEVAKEIISAFLVATFSGEERHQRRLEKLLTIENLSLKRNNRAI